jgi:hypothetical protein
VNIEYSSQHKMHVKYIYKVSRSQKCTGIGTHKILTQTEDSKKCTYYMQWCQDEIPVFCGQ